MTLSPTGQFQPFDSDKRYQRRMSYTDIWIDARESKEGCVSDTPNGKDAADADRLLNLKNHTEPKADPRAEPSSVQGGPAKKRLDR